MNLPTFQVKEKKWLSVVLFNLLIVATAGLILRAFHYTSVPVLNYSNFMEGHSHFAFGGWGFMALFVALFYSFLNEEAQKKKVYAYLFIATWFSVWGMLLSFPFQGYAVVSTIFSTIYIWLTYWFAFQFYRDTRNREKTIALRFARAALFFLVFSSLGPYTMGVFMASGYGQNPKAMNAIYFYLHFQYNGWLIFGGLALFFQWLQEKQISFPEKAADWFFKLLFWSCIPAVLLSFLWSNPGKIIFVVAGIAAIVQVWALFPFFRILYAKRRELKKEIRPPVKKIWLVVLVIFVLKYIFQLLGAFPDIVFWINATRHVIIAYLHWVLLGVFTLFILSYFIQKRMINFDILSRIGIGLFVLGFFITEGLLFAQSGLKIFRVYIPDFGSWMFFTTIPLPLGVLLLFFSRIKKIDK